MCPLIVYLRGKCLSKYAFKRKLNIHFVFVPFVCGHAAEKQVPPNLLQPLLTTNQQSLNKSGARGSACWSMNILRRCRSFFLTSSPNSAGCPLSWGCWAAAFLRLKRSGEAFFHIARRPNKPRKFTAWYPILALVLSFADLFLSCSAPLYEEDANLKGWEKKKQPQSKKEILCVFFFQLYFQEEMDNNNNTHTV